MSKNIMNRAASFVLALTLIVSSLVIMPANVNAATAKITLKSKKATVYVGKTTTIKVKKVTGLKNKKVTYKSSNKKVATVTKKGKVTGKAAGKATITVTSKANKKVKAKFNVTVKQQVTGIQTASKLVLQKGKSAKLSYAVSPSNAANKKVKFSSSNKKVATVNKNGKISAKKVGTANITVKSADGQTKAKVKVTVKKKVTAVKSIALDKKALTLEPGVTEQVKATVTPAKATAQDVYWVSKNAGIATVNKKGKITAKAEGTVKITAYATDNSGKKATVTVTVKKAETPVNPPVEQIDVAEVKVEPSKVTIKKGEKSELKVTVLPENATNKNVTWTTADDKVATVNEKNEVVAVGVGTTTVTATTHNNKTATVEVTVVADDENPITPPVDGEEPITPPEDGDKETPIIDSVDGTTIFTFKKNTDFTVTYNERKETLKASQLDAIASNLEKLAAMTHTDEVWEKITTDGLKDYAEKVDAEISVQEAAYDDIKTITVTREDETVVVEIERYDEATFKAVVKNDRINAKETVVRVSAVNMNMREALVTVDNKYTVKVAWDKDSIQVMSDDSSNKFHEFKVAADAYVVTTDDAFASEIYGKVLHNVVEPNGTPATYEEFKSLLKIDYAN